MAQALSQIHVKLLTFHGLFKKAASSESVCFENFLGLYIGAYNDAGHLMTYGLEQLHAPHVRHSQAGDNHLRIE